MAGANCRKYRMKFQPLARGEKFVRLAGCGSSLRRTGLWGLNSLLTGKSTANSREIRHQNLFELSQPSEVAALSAKRPLQGTRNSYRANSEYLEVKHGIGRH